MTDNKLLPISLEMNFCRRCGSSLKQRDLAHVYQCEQGHVLFANASPAIGVALFTAQDEVVILERAIEPGKGRLDVPGGFCDGAEPIEKAIARELEEEIGVAAADYSEPEFILSDIDAYAFRGEVLPVLCLMFKARIKGEVLMTAADDAASVSRVRLADLDIEKVYFPAVRKALTYLRDQSQS